VCECESSDRTYSTARAHFLMAPTQPLSIRFEPNYSLAWNHGHGPRRTYTILPLSSKYLRESAKMAACLLSTLKKSRTHVDHDRQHSIIFLGSWGEQVGASETRHDDEETRIWAQPLSIRLEPNYSLEWRSSKYLTESVKMAACFATLKKITHSRGSRSAA
jgi:hypothetical protein